MQAETATAQLKKEFQFTLSKLSHEIRNPIALSTVNFSSWLPLIRSFAVISSGTVLWIIWNISENY